MIHKQSPERTATLYRDFKAMEYVRDGLELILKCTPLPNNPQHSHMHTHTPTHLSIQCTIVPQLVGILMLVACYSVPAVDQAERETTTPKIWMALSNCRDDNHFLFDVCVSDIIHPTQQRTAA